MLLFAQATLFAQVTVGPERQLAVPELKAAATDQLTATTASDGDGWLVAWRSGGPENTTGGVIAATRIDSGGNVVDLAPIIIASGNVNKPAAAFGNGRYLIAWATPNEIRARLVGRDGVLYPTTEIATVSGGLFVSIVRAACDGIDFSLPGRTRSMPVS